MHTCSITFSTSLHTWHHLLHWVQHLIIVRHYFNHSHSSRLINVFVTLKLWADLISKMDFSLMQGSILLCCFNTHQLLYPIRLVSPRHFLLFESCWIWYYQNLLWGWDFEEVTNGSAMVVIPKWLEGPGQIGILSLSSMSWYTIDRGKWVVFVLAALWLYQML